MDLAEWGALPVFSKKTCLQQVLEPLIQVKRFCHLFSYVVDLFTELDNEWAATALTEASNLCQNVGLNETVLLSRAAKYQT